MTPSLSELKVDDLDIGQVSDALRWKTGIAEDSIVFGLATALPQWIQREILIEYQAHTLAEAAPVESDTRLRIDHRTMLGKRKAAEAFHAYL